MPFVLSFASLFFLFWLLFLGVEPALEHLLTRTAHWMAGFRYRDYLPVLLLVAAGIAVTALAGDAFIDIAERVHSDSPRLREIDGRTHQWARMTHTDGATLFFVTMAILGGPLVLGIVTGSVAVLLCVRKRYRWAAYLVLTTGIGGLLNLALKSFFERSRPELAEALREASGYSFPSGHAMGSTIVLGAMGYLALRIIPHWRWRAAALALAAALIIAIAASRVYLGVHWISDVGAGIAAGLIWVVTATLAYEVFRRIRLVRVLRAKRM